MKQVAPTFNHNLTRNSDAYMPSGGQTDPDDEFSWTDNAYKEDQKKFQLTY